MVVRRKLKSWNTSRVRNWTLAVVKSDVELNRRGTHLTTWRKFWRLVTHDLNLELKFEFWSVIYGSDLSVRDVDIEEKHRESCLQAFELWCYRRILKIPLTTSENQSGDAQDYEERPLIELIKMGKLNYFGRLIRGTRYSLLQRISMVGRIEGKRRIGRSRRMVMCDIEAWT